MKLWFNLANKLANTVNKLGNKHSKRTQQRKHSEQSKVFGSIWVEVQFVLFYQKGSVKNCSFMFGSVHNFYIAVQFN